MQGVRHTKLIFLSIGFPLLVGVVVGFLTLRAGIYAFGLYLLLGFAALSIFRTLETFYIYVLLYPLFSTFIISLGRGFPDVSFNRAAVLLIFVAALLRAYFNKISLTAGGSAEFWMAIFSLLSVFSMFLNFNIQLFIGKTLYFIDCFFIPFLLYFLARNIITDEERFVQFTKVLVITAIYLSIIAIYEEFTLHDLFPADYSSEVGEYRGLRLYEGIIRVNGPFDFPEAFGVVLAVIFITLTYHLGAEIHAPQRTAFIKFLSIFILPLLLVAMFFNMIRAVWLGTIVGLLIRFGISKKQRLKIMISIFVISLIGWGSSEMIRSTNVYQHRISDVATFYERIANYKTAISVFLDRPIFGVGFTNYIQTVEKYNYSNTFKGVPSTETAHNAFLAILAQNGIFAFLAYMLMLKSFFLSSFRLYKAPMNDSKKRLAETGFSLLGTFVVNSFFNNITLYADVNNLFFCIMGALAAQASRATDSLSNGVRRLPYN